MSTTNRRKFMGRGAAAAAVAAVPAVAQDSAGSKPARKVMDGKGKTPATPSRYSAMVSYGNLLFISGVGYHEAGDITVHTTKVLDQIQQELEAAGGMTAVASDDCPSSSYQTAAVSVTLNKPRRERIIKKPLTLSLECRISFDFSG